MLHGGGTFAFRLHEETGAPASEIARAYAIAREVFGMRPQWAAIEALDNEVIPRSSSRCCSRAGASSSEARAGSSVTEPRRWTSRSTVAAFSPGVGLLTLGAGAPRRRRPRADRAPGGRAARPGRRAGERVATLPTLYGVFDVVEVSEESGLPVQAVAAVHFRLGALLGLHWLRDRVVDLGRDDRWKARARSALRDDLYTIHRELTAEVLREGPPLESPRERVDAWVEDQQAAGRCLQTVADVRAGRRSDLTTLSVAVRESARCSAERQSPTGRSGRQLAHEVVSTSRRAPSISRSAARSCAGRPAARARPRSRSEQPRGSGRSTRIEAGAADELHQVMEGVELRGGLEPWGSCPIGKKVPATRNSGVITSVVT